MTERLEARGSRLEADHEPDRQRVPAPSGLEARASSLRAMLSTLKRIVGMPDYDGYCQHLRECHPERPLPTRKEHYEQYLKQRYGGGFNRCC